MQPLWTHNQAIEATGGICTGSFDVISVSIDTRSLKAGALYVAIVGERVDGHDYARQAIEAGAVAVMVSRPLDDVDTNKQLIVGDTLVALEALARHRRAASAARVVGVTGSVGKTGTKEMLRTMFSALGKTYASAGNFNNHIGAPLSLANMPLNTEFAIFEMGMNHVGEIRRLTHLVQPHAALITTIEPVHLEHFESVKQIAEAKCEIFDSKPELALINADNQWADYCAEKAEGQGAQVALVGQSEQADPQLKRVEPNAQGLLVGAQFNKKEVCYALSVTGQHWAIPSLMALAIANHFGCDMDKAAAALADFTEPAGRGQVSEIAINGGTAWLIDDSYNASPASMGAAFDRMDALAVQYPQAKRRVAVLGQMLELGPERSVMHAGLAEPLQLAGFKAVYSTGVLMQHLQDVLPAAIKAAHTDEADALIPILQAELRAGDLILCKGSNGSRVHAVVRALRD